MRAGLARGNRAPPPRFDPPSGYACAALRITLDVFPMERHGDAGTAVMLIEPMRLPSNWLLGISDALNSMAEVELVLEQRGEPAEDPTAPPPAPPSK